MNAKEEIKELRARLETLEKKIERLEPENQEPESWDLPNNIDFADSVEIGFLILFNDNKSVLGINENSPHVQRVDKFKPIDKSKYKLIRTKLDEITSDDVVFCTDHDSMERINSLPAWGKFVDNKEYWYVRVDDSVNPCNDTWKHYYKIVKR